MSKKQKYDVSKADAVYMVGNFKYDPNPNAKLTLQDDTLRAIRNKAHTSQKPVYFFNQKANKGKGKWYYFDHEDRRFRVYVNPKPIRGNSNMPHMVENLVFPNENLSVCH